MDRPSRSMRTNTTQRPATGDSLLMLDEPRRRRPPSTVRRRSPPTESVLLSLGQLSLDSKGVAKGLAAKGSYHSRHPTAGFRRIRVLRESKAAPTQERSKTKKLSAVRTKSRSTTQPLTNGLCDFMEPVQRMAIQRAPPPPPVSRPLQGGLSGFLQEGHSRTAQNNMAAATRKGRARSMPASRSHPPSRHYSVDLESSLDHRRRRGRSNKPSRHAKKNAKSMRQARRLAGSVAEASSEEDARPTRRWKRRGAGATHPFLGSPMPKRQDARPTPLKLDVPHEAERLTSSPEVLELSNDDGIPSPPPPLTSIKVHHPLDTSRLTASASQSTRSSLGSMMAVALEPHSPMIGDDESRNDPAMVDEARAVEEAEPRVAQEPSMDQPPIDREVACPPQPRPRPKRAKKKAVAPQRRSHRRRREPDRLVAEVPPKEGDSPDGAVETEVQSTAPEPVERKPPTKTTVTTPAKRTAAAAAPERVASEEEGEEQDDFFVEQDKKPAASTEPTIDCAVRRSRRAKAQPDRFGELLLEQDQATSPSPPSPQPKDKPSEPTAAGNVRRSRRAKVEPDRLGYFADMSEDDTSNHGPPCLLPLLYPAVAPERRGKVVPRSVPFTRPVVPTQDDLEDGWTGLQVFQLREAHRKADPTSVTFWNDVASLVDDKTAAECSAKWFSLVKTPAVKAAGRGKGSKKVHRPKLEEAVDDDDDDIFNSTPMRGVLLDGQENAAAMLPMDVDFGSAIKVRDASGMTDDSSDSAPVFRPKPGYKSYVQAMRRDVNRPKKGKKKKKPTELKVKNRLITDAIYDGDVDMNVRLSPGGTLQVKNNDGDEDDFWGEMYESGDDDEVEYY